MALARHSWRDRRPHLPNCLVAHDAPKLLVLLGWSLTPGGPLGGVISLVVRHLELGNTGISVRESSILAEFSTRSRVLLSFDKLSQALDAEKKGQGPYCCSPPPPCPAPRYPEPMHLLLVFLLLLSAERKKGLVLRFGTCELILPEVPLQPVRPEKGHHYFHLHTKKQNTPR